MTIKQRFARLIKSVNLYRANTGEYIDGYYRISGGTTVDGQYIEPPKTTQHLLEAVIQPNEEKRMQYGENSSNEAINLEGSIKIYTDMLLLTKKNNPLRDADKIIYEGQVYKIHRSAIWGQDPRLVYYKSIGILTEEKPSDLIAESGEPNPNDLVITLKIIATIPPMTTFRIDQNSTYCLKSGDSFTIGASANEFNNDTNILVQRNAINQDKNNEVFWVSSNEIRFNDFIDIGEEITILKDTN